MALVALVVALFAYGWDAADDDDDGGGNDLARELTGQLQLADIQPHLTALQNIANRSGGNRAAGSPGHERSVDYVAEQLRRAGFAVSTPRFDFETERVDAELVDVEGTPLVALQMEGTPNTPVGGVSGPLVVLADDPTSGCEPSDYAGFDTAGAVVLARRGTCPFGVKLQQATDAGAAALLVANNEPGPVGARVEGLPGPIPAGTLSQEDGDRLLDDAGADLTVDLRTVEIRGTSRNVIAETRTGDHDSVVMAGAHLDSVPEGPGINDNGSGSAGLLATALAMGPTPDTERAVRFAWWGAEEYGLIGSETYVDGLDADALERIELYVNFDMIGSPNAGYLVYDGDDSDRVGAPAGPKGSDRIEREFVQRLREHSRITADGTDFTGRSDYGPFIVAGIPAGGLFTGAEDLKNAGQVARYGGRANSAYDPCYHQACDTLANVNAEALQRMTDAMAWVIARYASGAADLPDR